MVVNRGRAELTSGGWDLSCYRRGNNDTHNLCQNCVVTKHLISYFHANSDLATLVGVIQIPYDGILQTAFCSSVSVARVVPEL